MLTDSQLRLLKAHREIDLTARTSPLPFISGWETVHPVRYDALDPLDRMTIGSGGTGAYRFMSDDSDLKAAIRGFHAEVDGAFPAGGDVFLGAGSSPLVSSVMILLSLTGHREVHYVKPMYHAYYYMAHVLGLRMTDLGDALTDEAEDGVPGRLPGGPAVLVVTDPSWISGRSLSPVFWHRVREWQARTGSLVVIDGTFQYTKWAGMVGEHSAGLDSDRTIRLVCPTKSLCVHGVRFAYLVLPERLTEDLGYVYCKLVAATSALDIRVAHLMMAQLRSPRNNRDLADYARGRYARLVAAGLIRDVVVPPDCTYYAYGRSGFDPDAVLTMNGGYFELPYPSDLVRINILSPDLPLGPH